jgi:hypothetical protein
MLTDSWREMLPCAARQPHPAPTLARKGEGERGAHDIGLVHEEALELAELGLAAQNLLRDVELPGEPVGVPAATRSGCAEREGIHGVPRELHGRRDALALELGAGEVGGVLGLDELVQRLRVPAGASINSSVRARGRDGLARARDAEAGGQRRAQRGEEGGPLGVGDDVLGAVVGLEFRARELGRRERGRARLAAPALAAPFL